MTPPFQPSAESAPFWAAAAQGRLVVQRCTACDAVQALPGTHCRQCQQRELRWVDASGRGRIASFTWVERAATPAFEAPYMLALIDLEEGGRLMMQIVGDDRQKAAIGTAVQIGFARQTPDAPPLPQARLQPDRSPPCKT